jgi:hypothetical protein
LDRKSARETESPVIAVKAKRGVWVAFAALFAMLTLATVAVALPHHRWYYDYHITGDLAILTFFLVAFLWTAGSSWTFKFYKSRMELARWGRSVWVDYSDIKSAKEKIARESRGLSRGDALYVDLTLPGRKKPVQVRATKDESNKELNLTLAAWLKQNVKQGAYISLPKEPKAKSAA